jgi:hypothetical protein
LILSKLDVAYYDGISHLSWVTAQENNTSHFEAEHSVNGLSFTKLGTVAAAGYSSQSKNYSFKDIKPNAGINYYRQKMVDQDGQFKYSNIVSVNIRITGNKVTGIYPSPFVDRLTITIASETALTAGVEVFDNEGKLVVTYTRAINKGINNINLSNLDKLSKGIYIIKVQMADEFFVQKLIK